MGSGDEGGHPRWHRGAALGVVALFLGCGSEVYHPALRITGEAGAPLPGAVAVWAGGRVAADAEGVIHLPGLSEPVLVRVEAPGHLAEPAALGFEDDGAELPLRLFEARPGRFVYHAGGDVMFGRRYLEAAPDARARDGSAPLIVPGDGGASAEALVAGFADAFAGADLKTVNLECSLGELPADAAYPGKRWILQSPPESTAALERLGVDVAVLGNNHQRDFLDAGVLGTEQTLAETGLLAVGGGSTAEAAAAVRHVIARDQHVALLSFTTVDGAWVNDHYPPDEAEAPAEPADEIAYQYEAHPWGFVPAGPGPEIPLAERRIGSAWALLEPALAQWSEADRAAAWRSATAVYPQLQDWAARYGHGGAHVWGPESVGDIRRASAEADVVIVNLHAGFQLASAAGDEVDARAREAIDAGADLVVAHHPHVLQGVRWYRGVPIAYSLGNLVFEQDFLETFDAAFLRVVWDAGRVLDLKVVPLQLVAYVPAPTAGRGALGVFRRVWAASLLPALARRDADDVVREVLTELGDVALPVVSRVAGTLRLRAGTPPREARAVQRRGDWLAIPADALLWPDDLPDGAEVGRDLFGWGDFEPVAAAETAGHPAHWTGGSTTARLSDATPGGRRCLRLGRSAAREEGVAAKAVARIPLPAHRLWRATGDGVLEPADGAARYSIQLWSRTRGEGGKAGIRLQMLVFDDLDPTRAPSTYVVREVVVPVRPSLGWSLQHLDLEPSLFAPDAETGEVPNTLRLSLELASPVFLDTRWWVDDLALVEWRQAALLPAAPTLASFVRGVAGDRVSLAVMGDGEGEATAP